MKKFLNELKEAMRRVDIKDYGFKLASINQQITDDKYEEFQEDIKNHDYCITCNEYEVSVFLYPSEEFCYRIRFSTEVTMVATTFIFIIIFFICWLTLAIISPYIFCTKSYSITKLF